MSTTFAKLFRISLSAAGVGVSLRVLQGIRVGRDSRGRLYLSVAAGPIRGRWFFPPVLGSSADETADSENPPRREPRGAVQLRHVQEGPAPGAAKVPRRDDGVYLALKGLSFTPAEIAGVWDDIPAEGKLEERIRAALRLIAVRAGRTA